MFFLSDERSIFTAIINNSGSRESAVGIATGYELDEREVGV
jgi:hypothetical protein